MDTRNQNIIHDGFGRTQFSNFEIMYKKLIVLIVEGEIEVDKFIDIQVLKTRIVSNDDIGNMIDGEKRAIISFNLGKEQINLVLKHEFVDGSWYFKRQKQLLGRIIALHYFDKMTIFALYYKLFLVGQISHL